MDIDALRDSPVGELLPIEGTDPRTMREYHHYAFLPAPLPARLDLAQETWTQVKAGFDAAWQDIEKGYEKLKAKVSG